MKTLFLLLLTAPAAAAGTIDDSDLAGPPSRAAFARLRREGPGGVFKAQESIAVRASGSGAVAGTLVLADRAGANHPARLAQVKLVGAGAAEAWTSVGDDGRFSIALPAQASGSYKLRFSLDNRYWAFHNPNGDAGYEWETEAFSPATGLDLGVLRPDPASENGKLAVLHLTYLEALEFLKKNADLDWWTNTLTINYPGSGDFFSSWGFSLDLTNPIAWDVVLHELGHAVQYGAMKPAGAGGSHKIDECYSEALAWSEGWATFFAGAVRLDAGDADAKFEFLVPRRAPIRIENVPEDVCKGQASEWRVAAGLWDLYDTHIDGLDLFSMSFNRIWKSLRGQPTDGIASAWALIAKDLNPVERKGAENSLIQNTLLPQAAPLSVRLPSAPTDWSAPR